MKIKCKCDKDICFTEGLYLEGNMLEIKRSKEDNGGICLNQGTAQALVDELNDRFDLTPCPKGKRWTNLYWENDSRLRVVGANMFKDKETAETAACGHLLVKAGVEIETVE